MNTRQLVLMGPVLIFLAAMLWASDAPFRVHLTQSLASNFIVFAEHGVDCLVAIPLLMLGWRDLKNLTKREWLAVGFVAIGGSALGSILFTESFHYVNPSVAILLQKVQPLIAIVLAYFFLGEALHPKFWLWSVVALMGAYLISFPGIVPQTYAGEVFEPNVIGTGLALLAAALWGASTVFGKYVLSSASFRTMTGLRFVVAFIFLGFLNAAAGTFPSSMSATDWLFIAIIALCSGVFSLYLYYFALHYTRASIATIAELGFPLAAVFVNAYFIPGNVAPGTYFGLAVGQWFGTALLILAVLMLTRVNQEESI